MAMSEANGSSLQPESESQIATGGEPETAVKRKSSGQENSGWDEREMNKRRKGVAPVREEYLLKQNTSEGALRKDAVDDDAAEASHHHERGPAGNNSKNRQKNKGQNTGRKFGKSQDDVRLCSTRIHAPEFSPVDCSYGNQCRFEHDLRKYLKEHKREDLTTFSDGCPVWQLRKACPAGWKCRFVGSHSKEVEREDGRKELVLVVDEATSQSPSNQGDETETGVGNSLAPETRISLTRRKVSTPKADAFLKWLEKPAVKVENPEEENGKGPGPSPEHKDTTLKEDNRAIYHESPFRPSEKRRLYFDATTPVLAPLTTQGNLPFRRLCTTLGASFTYSEMAMSLPLVQGHKPEWALIKAHESELQPPTLTNKDTIVQKYPSYNPATDIRFGAQIAANKPWIATKATEVLTTLLPPTSLRCIDLNVGCPIDLVFREGAGSALLDSQAKLCRILQGMNACSGLVPITCKIRTGTKDGRPTAHRLVERLLLGTPFDTPSPNTPAGIAAITLHGRSRQQRYTRNADWEYIASTAALIKCLNAEAAAATDTAHAPDERDLPASASASRGPAPVFFLGNGDVYTPEAYSAHIRDSGVDGVMIGRAALQKPWIFEEIAVGSQLDKSASERLGYVEQFCRHGLEAWGSDEWGVGTTRRFLLEWLSFACRYVPVGLLERVGTGNGDAGAEAGDGGWGQPSIQDRAPAYRGRNELETLLASDNYRDWIKISEMFLGPAHKDFRFEPKHKSNAYEIEGEG